MSVSPQSTPSDNTEHSVCNSVLTQLETGGIQPRSRWVFRSRECVVWTLWLLTVIVGALAVAVTLYVSMSVPYMLYEATHANALTVAVQTLPYLWVIIFAVMACLAIYNLRHTKRGYRYSTVELLASSVAVSMLLGIGLQYVGGGYVLDQTLGSWVAMYPSHEKQRLSVWQQPGAGRMVGTLVPIDERVSSGSSTEQFVFQDIEEHTWQVDVSELGDRDLQLLHDNGTQRVRVVGTTTAPGTFHVCGVFAWLDSEELTWEALERERTAFLQSLNAHLKPVDPSPDAATQATADKLADPSAAAAANYPCRSTAAVQRARQLLAQ